MWLFNIIIQKLRADEKLRQVFFQTWTDGRQFVFMSGLSPISIQHVFHGKIVYACIAIVPERSRTVGEDCLTPRRLILFTFCVHTSQKKFLHQPEVFFLLNCFRSGGHLARDNARWYTVAVRVCDEKVISCKCPLRQPSTTPRDTTPPPTANCQREVLK